MKGNVSGTPICIPDERLKQCFDLLRLYRYGNPLACRVQSGPLVAFWRSLGRHVLFLSLVSAGIWQVRRIPTTIRVFLPLLNVLCASISL
jgi:hypothetical protein